MAFFVDVFRMEDHPPLQRRQSPVMIEDNLMMVMDLSVLDLFEEEPVPDGRDFYEFMQKYILFSERELYNVFQVGIRDIMAILNETIPCVGCRRSVERFHAQLTEIGESALDPLLVQCDGCVRIRESALSSPRWLCALLSDHSERLSQLVDSQPRSKKSRRCLLHSWDLQKSRPVTPAWKELWTILDDKCKAEVLLIEFSMLLAKLENYLKKHRFCTECRTKVMKAYNLLVEDGDPTKEKGFVPALYNKIKRCSPRKHIHLQAETKYIESLIARAEPELMGNRRERHAKTMEIAQEEVLTCVGICIYDRLHRIYLRLKEEEFTCRILAAAAMSALYRSFETLVEEKTGVSRLELLYREITEQDRAQRQRKELKKLKKKRKKNHGKRLEEERGEEEDAEDEGMEGEDEAIDGEAEDYDCLCPKVKPPENGGDRHKLQILGGRKTKPTCICDECVRKKEGSKVGGRRKGKERVDAEEQDGGQCISCSDVPLDNGYASESAVPTSSASNSSDGSDVACSEGFCDYEGDCLLDGKNHSRKPTSSIISLTLEEMLEKSQSDEDDFIPAEDIQAFRARNRQVNEKRTKLREKLKSQFQQLLSRTQATHS